MSGVTLTGDWQKFSGHLEKMVFFDFKGLHAEIGEYLVAETKLRFKKERGPAGHPWKKSARAKNRGGKTLTDKARLKRSIGYSAGWDSVAVGTNDKRAAIHQKGGTIKPKNKKYLAFKVGGKRILTKKVKMPQRAFLGINKRNTKDIRGIVQRKIARTIP